MFFLFGDLGGGTLGGNKIGGFGEVWRVFFVWEGGAEDVFGGSLWVNFKSFGEKNKVCKKKFAKFANFANFCPK